MHLPAIHSFSQVHRDAPADAPAFHYLISSLDGTEARVFNLMVTATFVTTPRHSSDYISLTGNQHESSSPLSSSTARIEKHGCSSTQHRQRFLSDAERRLSEDLGKTRASMESMDVADRKLWHCQPPATVAKLLDVNFKTGLNTHDAQARLAESGKNVLEAESKTPIHILFLLQFANLIVLMLLFASFASIALQEWVEGIAILMISKCSKIGKIPTQVLMSRQHTFSYGECHDCYVPGTIGLECTRGLE